MAISQDCQDLLDLGDPCQSLFPDLLVAVTTVSISSCHSFRFHFVLDISIKSYSDESVSTSSRTHCQLECLLVQTSISAFVTAHIHELLAYLLPRFQQSLSRNFFTLERHWRPTGHGLWVTRHFQRKFSPCHGHPKSATGPSLFHGWNSRPEACPWGIGLPCADALAFT
ncbi:hypothetical protein EI94DRAFT_1729275 [Lactarius quietus]|nr:hypothetical protein EI94DRAFT_1729275 [Lactarius quietus]